jgi:hypothetical protein
MTMRQVLGGFAQIGTEPTHGHVLAIDSGHDADPILTAAADRNLHAQLDPDSVLGLGFMRLDGSRQHFRQSVTDRRHQRRCWQRNDPGDHDIAGDIPAHRGNLPRRATPITVCVVETGWRIVKTVGSKITRITPVQGFCASAAGAVGRTSARSHPPESKDCGRNLCPTRLEPVAALHPAWVAAREVAERTLRQRVHLRIFELTARPDHGSHDKHRNADERNEQHEDFGKCQNAVDDGHETATDRVNELASASE